MMIADALISQIQIALIGIVVVIGLFFVWRSMSRVEDKLDRVLEKLSKAPQCLPGSNTCAFGWNGDEDMAVPEDADAAAEEFMRTVFGGSSASMFSSGDVAKPSEDVTVVEELLPPSRDEKPTEPEVAHEEMSEADTDAVNPLSKYKLKKMNVDTLKDLCRERGLSTEGSKAVLTDRLLGLIRE